jgi:two-component system, cell cycle sensor histidine kinase and response regulator CckA
MKKLDLRQVVEDFGKIISRVIGGEIQLKVALSETPVEIKADRSQLEQILMNLAVNAKDAMPNGGEFSISTSVRCVSRKQSALLDDIAPGEYAMLLVRDTGCGMTEETKKMVFEPFFTTKEVGKGTGLGLATVHGIVSQHGGHVAIESAIGKGTTFTILIPTDAGEDEECAKTRESAEGSASTARSETILVTDDEEPLRRLTCAMLEAKGFHVISASNGEEALELAESSETPIGLLITDVIMPGLNGRQLFEKLNDKLPGLKVLFISGYTSNAIAHHGVLDDGLNFLAKPFQMKLLIDKVEGILAAI